MQDSFFEVDYPMRADQPDPLRFYREGARPLKPMLDSRRLELHALVQTFPSVGAVKELLDAEPPSTSLAAELNRQHRFPPVQENGLLRFPVKQSLRHEQVLDNLHRVWGYPKGSATSNDGLQKEENAWKAVRKLFGGHSSPDWSKTFDFGKVLKLEMALPSVWLETIITRIPRVIDQLWVLSSIDYPERKVLLAVEIDGPHKFKFAPNGDPVPKTPAAEQAIRTKELFSAGLNVCRINSDLCSSLGSAEKQVQSVWSRLCACEVVLRNSRWASLLDEFEDVDHRLAQAKIWARDCGAPRVLSSNSAATTTVATPNSPGMTAPT